MKDLVLYRHRKARSASFPNFKQQRGIVLIVALLVLVALTIASLGLLRSVDTTTAATGNLGFKKDMYRQSNRGIQDVLNKLVPLRSAQGELPYVNSTGAGSAGYYARSTELPVDPRGIPLILLNAPVPSTPGVATGTPNLGEFAVPIGDINGGGYVFRFTTERLCPAAGEPNRQTNPCREATGVGAFSTGTIPRVVNLPGKVYVRLTLRIDGPKNAVSYFQAMIL